MLNILIIARKEIVSYFSSPMAYIIAAVFLLLSGVFFASYVNQAQIASLQGFFQPASFIVILLAPVLTMRLLAEEQKMGTLELLLTAPVRDREVVLGKFLAALTILLVMLALTFYYPMLLFWFGDPDLGTIFSGYLAMVLLGGVSLAVGLLASSMTSNQIVAAIVGLGILLVFWVIQFAAQIVGSAVPAMRDLFNYLALNSHFSDMVSGVVDTGSLVYYLSFIVAVLFLTVRSLETRRWR